MGMMGFCTAPSLRSAPNRTMASIHVGWIHDTTSPSPTPWSAASPAAARSARSRYSPKVMRRPVSSTASSRPGVAWARRTIRSQMLRPSSIGPLPSSLQTQQRVEPDGQSRPPTHLFHGQHHTRHEARAVVGVVADGQRLAGGAQQHLLVRDQAPQAHRVHGDPASRHRPPGAGQHLLAGGVLAPLGRRVGHAPGGQHGGARRRVDLLVVVQLDDLGGLEPRSRELGEAHHEHGPDGEVGRDQAVAAGEGRADAVVVLGREPGGSHDRVHPVLGRPGEVGPGGVQGREVHDNLGVDGQQRRRIGVDVHVGVDAGGVPQVEARVVRIDGAHQLELGVFGNGPAHGAPHAPSRPPLGVFFSPPPATLTPRGLTVAAGPRLLLADVDLVVAPGDRLGLVGPNGSGKSTFLKILAGLRAPEDGHVRLAPPSAAVGYLPQEPRPRAGDTVRDLLPRRTGVWDAAARLDATTAALAAREPGADTAYAAALDRWLGLGGTDLDARAGAVAADLGLPNDLMDRPTVHLSGGQAARVQLAALLLARFDVFLLDEPTNDLDLDGLDRLERFVLGLEAPLVVVSHDRAFLERTVTAVAEIDDHAHSLTRYDGGWTAYLDERARARQHAEQDYRTYVDQRATLTDRARTQRQWAAKGARTAKRSGETDKFIRHRRVQSSESMAAHARRTEKALARLAPVEKPWEGWDLRLSIADAGRAGDVVARLDDVVVELRADATDADGQGFVLGPVSLEVGWGDRMAIVGANGS